jgi:hypothetical protein
VQKISLSSLLSFWFLYTTPHRTNITGSEVHTHDNSLEKEIQVILHFILSSEKNSEGRFDEKFKKKLVILK